MSRRTGPPAEVVQAIRERDEHRCMRCATLQPPLTSQHRTGRGSGGSTDPAINLPSNLITLCGSGTTGCHGWVEAHPVLARVGGWHVWRYENPAEVPVYSKPLGSWISLDNDTGYELLEVFA